MIFPGQHALLSEVLSRSVCIALFPDVLSGSACIALRGPFPVSMHCSPVDRLRLNDSRDPFCRAFRSGSGFSPSRPGPWNRKSKGSVNIGNFKEFLFEKVQGKQVSQAFNVPVYTAPVNIEGAFKILKPDIITACRSMPVNQHFTV